MAHMRSQNDAGIYRIRAVSDKGRVARAQLRSTQAVQDAAKINRYMRQRNERLTLRETDASRGSIILWLRNLLVLLVKSKQAASKQRHGF